MKKALLVSLGCDKNLVDSERILGKLAKEGWEITEDETEAELIVINTCCFIGDAKEESINTIIEMGRLKQEGCCRRLVVTGCLGQRYREDILRELPEVDAVYGVEQIGDRRIITTGGHYEFLKIAEGCDKYCTYCIIPKVRGHFRSFPMEDLVAEAEDLVSRGVRELILVAQETTLYGVDLYGHKALPELLKRLCAIPDLNWIRLQYCYPEEITEELIRVIRDEDKICKYLDIPIQHASDRILKRMGRRTTEQSIRSMVTWLREEIPGIALRTTLISGFPGETDADQEIQMAFVDDMEFDRLGVFAYSREEDTPAGEMPDQVEEAVKAARRDEIMELQQEISAWRCAGMVGQELEVFIEGKLVDEDVYVGRTYRDAPQVDGWFFLKAGRELMSGDIVRAKVTEAMEYDLAGELVDVCD